MKKFISLLLAMVMLFSLAACAPEKDTPAEETATPVESAVPAEADDVAITDDVGYVDYSSDKTAIFFNTSGKYNNSVFFDFYYPFDSSLKLNHYDALIKYDMAEEIVLDGDAVLVSLDELSRLYAPYFTYGVEDGNVTARHIQFTKTVTEGAGTRTPKLDYVKTIWEVKFDLAGENIAATKDIYEAFNTTAAKGVVEAMDAAGIKETVDIDGIEPFETQIVDGKVYVSVADLMAIMGKNVFTSGHYLTIRSEDIVDTITANGYKKADPANLYTYAAEDQNYTWADYMDGVLDGTNTKGHQWRAFYVGTEDLIYSNGPTADQDEVKENVEVDRIIPYNVYIPESYDPATPSKLTFELHGATGNENAPTERISDRDLHIEPYADEYGYIVLMPNGWTRGPAWVEGPARYSFLKAFEMVCDEYNVDAEKVFISGNSAGGGGSWNLAIKYPEMFKAAAVEAPVTSMQTLTDENIAGISQALEGMPVMFEYGVSDVTIPYYTKHAPWVANYADKLFDENDIVFFTCVESGHHSYSFGSATQQKFDFFDSALEPYADTYSFETLTLEKNGTTAKLDEESYTLDKATKTASGVTMIAISELEKIYGESFKVYNVAAYDKDPTAKDPTVTILYKNTAVNIKPDSTYLRVNAELYTADVPQDKAGEEATGGGIVSDYIVETRQLKTATITDGDELYVPAVEIMQLFGESVIA